MRRIDWQLIRPAKPGATDTAREGLARVRVTLSRLLRLASEEVLTGPDLDALVAAEEQLRAATISPCRATGAPRVGDDKDWESRAIDEFSETETDLDLEEFLSLRRSEPDCERCPFASPYSLFPQDPCEFSAGGLLEMLDAPELVERVLMPLDPGGMIRLASALDAALKAGQVHDAPGVSADDYVRQAAFFLRFWAGKGFSILPVAIDDLPAIATPEEPGETSLMLH